MYYPQFYTDLDRQKIADSIQKDGFDPMTFSNDSGFVYAPHKHPETKLLVFLKGSMEVTFNNETHHCVPGDKVIIPGNTIHSAVVGPDGCTFFWSEKIMS